MRRTLIALVAAGLLGLPALTSAAAAQESPDNPGDARNCTDFATQAEAQTWYSTYFPLYGDVAQLDADGDGIACDRCPAARKRKGEEASRTQALAAGANRYLTKPFDPRQLADVVGSLLGRADG